jgi:hypothetical protein
VFNEMGEAGMGLGLVARSGADGEAAIRGGRIGGEVGDSEAVGEGKVVM